MGSNTKIAYIMSPETSVIRRGRAIAAASEDIAPGNSADADIVDLVAAPRVSLGHALASVVVATALASAVAFVVATATTL